MVQNHVDNQKLTANEIGLSLNENHSTTDYLVLDLFL